MCPRPEQVRDIAVVVRIKIIGDACQDLGKRPRSDIKISSKCTRLPFGGLVHETTTNEEITCIQKNGHQTKNNEGIKNR